MKPGLIPISYGITGHRDIASQDVIQLRGSVTDLLCKVRQEHPDSPLVLITSLAEGADRIAAQAALDCGWQIAASLPMSPSEFEKDFSDSASVYEFRDLLKKALCIRVDSNQARPECYADASRWMAEHVQVLIALWDGNTSGAIGGTADTVRIFLEGADSQRLALPDTGLVIQVVTRRQRSFGSIPEAEIGKIIHHVPRPAGFSETGEQERWTTILHRINQFNRDAKSALADFRPNIDKNRSYLQGGKSLDDDSLPPDAISASWMHAVADFVSSATQQERNRHFWKIVAVAVLAIFFEQIYSGPIAHPGFLAAAVSAGLVAFWLFRKGSQCRLEERYIDYRSLAEGCRVQHYWKISGVPDGVATHFLRDQRDELEWIRQAILGTELVSNYPRRVSDDASTRCKSIRDHWINDQRHYFVGTAGKAGGNKFQFNDETSTRLERYVRALMFLAIGLMVALVIFHWQVAPDLGDAGDQVVQVLIVSYGMLFATAGVTKAYLEVKDFAGQAQRYRRIGLAMSMAQHRIDNAFAADDSGAALNVLLDVGKIALRENSDWLLVHRERPVSVPIG